MVSVALVITISLSQQDSVSYLHRVSLYYQAVSSDVVEPKNSDVLCQENKLQLETADFTPSAAT